MIDLVNPALLWGATAVAAPILIHLLMRQRPRPRPWGAMRWLLAAVQVAQRRYKLTNLLLLLLRCLLLAMLALAIARPSIAGLGSGGTLVLVCDTTASMGPTGSEGGALRQALAGFEEHGIPHHHLILVLVGDGVQVRHIEPGGLDEALRRIETTRLPGGLDQLADGEGADRLLAACDKDSDVILLSDFRQDDGGALVRLLKDRVRSVIRLRAKGPERNALITELPPGTGLLPGISGELLLGIAGEASTASVSIDEGQELERDLISGEGLVRIQLPPMAAGEHLVRVRLHDQGLTYDDLIELPVRIRAVTPAIVVQDHMSGIAAALLADTQRLDADLVGPASLAGLPPRGLLALRQRPAGDARRIADWLRRDGGVLWAPLEVLQQHPDLAPLAEQVGVAEEAAAGGPLHTGQADVDGVFSQITVNECAALRLPPGAEVLLRAGDTPLVAALPVGEGWLIVESEPLEGIEGLDATPPWPLWVQRQAWRILSRLDRPQIWQAGSTAPQDAELEREGRSSRVSAGQPLHLAPGLWQRRTEMGLRPVVVLPSRAEGRTAAPPPPESVASVAEALPAQPGRDWGPSLLVLVLLIALGEGALAAWAGRTYGR